MPEYPADLVPDDSYILEMGFERLNGVDFRKGCYVGQEVTARMQHKTELRKGLVRLRIEGTAPPGTPITLEDGREAGRLGTVCGDRALAHLRFDRLQGPLLAGPARLIGRIGRRRNVGRTEARKRRQNLVKRLTEYGGIPSLVGVCANRSLYVVGASDSYDVAAWLSFQTAMAES